MNNNGTTIKSHRGIMYNVFSLLNTWKKAIKKQEEKKKQNFLPLTVLNVTQNSLMVLFYLKMI